MKIRSHKELRVWPDEILVQSFPGPDRSIPMEELKAGRPVGRRYRNRRIGEFLKELELSEGRNTGIPTIQKAMADNGSPPVRFETDEDRTYLLVRLPLRSAPEPEKTNEGEVALPPVSDPVSDPVSRILRVLSEGALPPAVIQRKLGIKHRPTFRKNYLRPALAQELVEMTLPDKPSSSLQKYSLTEAGRTWLAKHP